MCPIEVVSLKELDQRYKQSRQSYVQDLPEFADLKVKLGAGIKSGEAVVLSLTSEMQKKLGANPRATVKRHVKRLFSKMKLTEYTIRGLKDGDKQVLIIAHADKGNAKAKR